MRRRRSWTIAGLGVGALCAIWPAVSAAQSTIHSCVGPLNGYVRIVGDPTTCKNYEDPMSWRVLPVPGTGRRGPLR
jgi:hypothetical protein